MLKNVKVSDRYIYGTAKNKPPHIEDLLRVFRGAATQGLCFGTKEDVDKTLLLVSTLYSYHEANEGVFRFLLEEGVLLRDADPSGDAKLDRFYFDGKRAKHVAHCIERSRPTEKTNVLLRKDALERLKKYAPSPPPVPMNPGRAVPEIQKPEIGAVAASKEQYMSEKTEQVADEQVIVVKPQSEFHRLCLLPGVERVVWADIARGAPIQKETVVDEQKRTYEELIGAGVLRLEDGVFSLARPIETFIILNLEERRVLRVNRDYLAIARTFERGALKMETTSFVTRDSLYDQFVQLIMRSDMSEKVDPSALSAVWENMNGTGMSGVNWEMIASNPHGAGFIVAVQGFESLDLVPDGRAPYKPAQGGKEKPVRVKKEASPATSEVKDDSAEQESSFSKLMNGLNAFEFKGLSLEDLAGLERAVTNFVERLTTRVEELKKEQEERLAREVEEEEKRITEETLALEDARIKLEKRREELNRRKGVKTSA
ncbi:MAG: hypothetical protein WCJ29_01710 [bacterium]